MYENMFLTFISQQLPFNNGFFLPLVNLK